MKTQNIVQRHTKRQQIRREKISSLASVHWSADKNTPGACLTRPQVRVLVSELPLLALSCGRWDGFNVDLTFKG